MVSMLSKQVISCHLPALLHDCLKSRAVTLDIVEDKEEERSYWTNDYKLKKILETRMRDGTA